MPPASSRRRAWLAATASGSSAVRSPRLSDANGPSDTPPWRVVNSTRASPSRAVEVVAVPLDHSRRVLRATASWSAASSPTRPSSSASRTARRRAPSSGPRGTPAAMRSSPVIASRRWRSCASQRRASGVPVAATASAGAVPNARSATDGGAPARSTARSAAAASQRPPPGRREPDVGHVASDGRQHGERRVAGVAEHAERPLDRRAVHLQPGRQAQLHGALQRGDGVGLGEREAQLVADPRARDGGERARGDRLAGQLARARLDLEAEPGAVAREAPEARRVVEERPVVQHAQQPRPQVVLRARRLAQPPVPRSSAMALTVKSRRPRSSSSPAGRTSGSAPGDA